MKSTKYAPKAAGILFIALIVLHILGTVLFDYNSIPRNMDETLLGIAENPIKAQISFFLLLGAHWGALVLAIMLYLILRPFDKNLALLAMSFRMAEAFVGLYSDTNALDLIDLSQVYANAPASNASFLLTQAEFLFRSFINASIAGVGAITFAVGSFLFNYLFYKSRYVPRFISVFGMIASLLVFVAMVIGITTVGYGSVILTIWILMMISELMYGFWLPLKGVRNFSR